MIPGPVDGQLPRCRKCGSPAIYERILESDMVRHAVGCTGCDAESDYCDSRFLAQNDWIAKQRAIDEKMRAA